MIRTSKHILKYNTNYKDSVIGQFYEDFNREVQYRIDQMFSEELVVKKMLSTTQFSNYILQHSRWKQLAYKQASEIFRSVLKKDKQIRYRKYKRVYSYFKEKNRQLNFLNKRFSELNLKIKLHPQINNISINLDSRFLNIEKNKSKEFDEFIQLTSPYFKNGKRRATKINLPLKYHKHSLKFKDWNRRNTIQLQKINNNFYINLFWEKEFQKNDNKKSLGIDVGYKKLIATSDRQVIGKDLDELYKRISNKKQGSKKFKKLLIYRDNLINEVINKNLQLADLGFLYVEDLKNVKKKSKYGKKSNNKLQRWSYQKTLTKLEQLCEENGILYSKVNPAYSSQECSLCGHIDKENRQGESFKCKSCGMEADADYNASVNILHRGVYSLSVAESNFNEVHKFQ